MKTLTANSTRIWKTDCDGIITMSVTSKGTTGPQWEGRLERKGARISNEAREILHSKSFGFTADVTSELIIIPGKFYRHDNVLTTQKVDQQFCARKLMSPVAEHACLLREALSDEDIEDMGLRQIVVMHPPFTIDDCQKRLGIDNRGSYTYLNTHSAHNEALWDKDTYAFAWMLPPKLSHN